MSADPKPAAPAYDLDRLGWLQFERLCSLVLDADAGLADPGWIGRAYAVRRASLDGPLAFASRPIAQTGAAATLAQAGAVTPDHAAATLAQAGAVTVAVIWVAAGLEPVSRRYDFARRVNRLADEGGLGPEHTILALTNLDATDAHETATAWLRPTLLPRLVVLGLHELSETIDRHPGVRAGLPSVLGLRDLAPLIPTALRDRSTFDVDAARALARVFSPTRAFDRARAVLDRHRFAVLTGPPEMGKTAIARMIALALLTDGWEAHECNSPEQVWAAFDPGRRQVFVADDAFGSTEYRPDAADRWAHELARLLEALDDRHRLIWTSRPAPLKAGLRRVQRERGSERFPAPAEILVDAGDLDLAERTLILFRHAKEIHGGPPVRRLLGGSTGARIVEHPHFTPERIRRLTADRRAELLALAAGDPPPRSADAPPTLGWRRLIEQELTTPTDAMSTSFAALGPEHQAILIAMLDVPAGFVEHRELAATVRRHHPGGLTAPPADLIDRLTDHFLRVTPLGIGWVHPSWRDLVIDRLRDDAAGRRRFLSACGLHGAMLALSRAGGPTGERTLPLLLTDADWDVLTDRVHDLIGELDDRDLARLVSAIGDATLDPASPGQAAEAASLADYALSSTRRAWDAERRAVPTALLEAWYAVNACLSRPTAPPRLGPSWAELHPAPQPTPGRTGLIQADEWLRLAQLLDLRDPAALAALGFPARYGPALERLIAAAETAVGAADDQLCALAQTVLGRIRTLAPTHATATARARSRLALDAAVRRDQWWVPGDLDAPPTDKPAGLPHERFDIDDVARVLRDL
ncbi:MAG TPA: hypothetical protein VG165_03305 [Solirubrobacteraceae bacterium]|nr:hypothetical protein [Solirubrobacteraceae bacterium]